jgi:murein DD-endopeptidase MepM/ murein hydrolase activator NlpD
MANYLSPAKITGELAISKIDNYNELLAKEELLFPADELYNSNWDTVNVNPFKSSGVTFPDSYTIKCSTFTLPVDNEIKITSKYGIRRRRMHTGTDLKVYVGDTIRAAFEGKVRIKRNERRGYGNFLVLRHPNGLETVYGHLSKFLVKENQIVQSGQAIGIGGSTGRSSGSHLHFETRFLGRDINPEEIIDFANGVPHKDEYVFHNIKVNGKKTNIYATSADATAIHKVKKGETLGHIAIKYGTTVDELCKLNGITRTSTLSIGQAIRFRSKQISVEATPEAIQQTTQAQKTAATSQNSTKSVVGGAIQTISSDGPIFHNIEAGDTLYSLAKKYGTTIEKLCELNNFNENIIIKIGQKIRCS